MRDYHHHNTKGGGRRRRDNDKGYQRNEKAGQCVMKANHDEGRGSFHFFFSPRPPRPLTPTHRLM